MTNVRQDCHRVAASCACLRVRQAARVITQRYDEALAPIGLRATQFSVLVGAGMSEQGTPLGALARRLVIDRTTLTRNLALLEKDGLIETAASPGDARTKVIRLSAKGRRTLERALPPWEKAQEQLRADLGVDGWEDLHGRLRNVVALADST